MDCDTTREAVSARIDGEDPGVPDAALEAHLLRCAACRQWQQRAHAVTRRTRLGGAFLDYDLTPAVLAAVPAAEAGWRGRTVQRGALLMLALAQLARGGGGARRAAPEVSAQAAGRPADAAALPACGGDGRDESVA